MNRLPDAATLDMLVIGADDPEDRAAWEALVRLPGGAEAWGAAVARRRRLDLVTRAVRGRSWLASAMHSMSVLSRRLRTKPTAELRFAFPDAQIDALAGAALGPDDGGFADEEIQPRWGQTVPVHLQFGDRIGLHVVTNQAIVDVRYLSQGRDGPLPSRTWRLEPGEAPVLLVALIGADAGSPLSDALAQATAIAGVLVLEAAPVADTSA